MGNSGRLMGIKAAYVFACLCSLLCLMSCSIGGSGGNSSTSSSASTSFSFTQPASGTQIAGDAPQAVVLTWISQGTPVVSQSVTFSTNLGSLINSAGQVGSTATVSTQKDGTASIQIVSSTAGSATVTATAVDPSSGANLSATLPLTVLGAPSVLTVQAPSPIATNGSSVVSAVVKDSTGDALPAVAVNFSLSPANAGTLSAESATTNSSGTASVLFTPNGSVETVTVNVSVASLSPQAATIQVTQAGNPPPAGTISFSPCAATIPSGSTANCSVILVGATGQAIVGTTITLTASEGTVTPSSGATGANGALSFSYAAPTSSTASTATLTASAAVNSSTVTQTFNVALQPTTFSFTQPASGSEVSDNVQQALTLQWSSQGNPVASQPVTFSTSQGDLVDSQNNIGTSLTEQTQSTGASNVNLLASTTGAVTVTATAKDPTSGALLSTTLALNAVGAPSTLTASAPSPIQANGSSVVSAVVKDASGDAISGVAVGFALQGGGGALSTASVITNSSGTALSLFTPDGTAATVTIQVTSPPLTAQTVTINVSE